jgi:hypothetical protein
MKGGPSPWREFAAGLLWGATVSLAGAAAGGWALGRAGLGLVPASAAWQVAVVLAANAALVAAVAGRLVSRPGAMVDRPGARLAPVASPFLRAAAPIGCGLVLSASAFGPGVLGGSVGGTGTSILSRRDRLIELPATRSASSPVSYYVAAGRAVRRGEGLRRVTVDAPGGPATGWAAEAGAAPAAGQPGRVRVGARAWWPLAFPPDRLTLTPDSAPLMARLRWPAELADPDGGPAFDLPASLPATAPTPGLDRTAVEQWMVNPVGPEVARLARVVTPGYWAGPLYRVRDGETFHGRAGNPLVITNYLVKATGRRLYEGRPVLAARGTGKGHRYTYRWADEEPLDLLGETGDCVYPARLFEGCVLTWRSRTASAPGLLALPEEPSGGAPSRWPTLLADRGLPPEYPDRASGRAAGALGALALVLLGVHWCRVVIRG